MNLFDISENDQSLYYLAQLFGRVGTVLPNVQGSSALLGTLFQTINTIALTVGAIIVVYTTVVGLLATAHEGEFLGKKWSGLWVPIRMVLGIASLFPASSGYSALQIVLMWIIVQGIGAADMVWTTALNYLEVVGSPYGSPNLPSVDTNLTMQNFFKGLACQASAQVATPNIQGPGYTIGYFCANKQDPFCNNPSTFPNSGSTYSMGPLNSCGTLQYCDKSVDCVDQKSLKCAVCNAQQQVLPTILGVLQPIANAVVNDDYTFAKFYTTIVTNPGDVNDMAPDWVKKYCAAQGIPAEQCCVMGEPESAKLCPYSAMFYGAARTGSGNITVAPNNYSTNANTDAVKNIYQPYGTYGTLTGGIDFIQASADMYVNAISSAITQWIATQGDMAYTGWKGDAQKAGWLLAGGYYYSIAGMEGNSNTDTIPVFSIKEPSNTLPASPMDAYRNNYYTVADLISAIESSDSTPDNFSSTIPSEFSAMSSALNEGLGLIAKSFINSLEPGTGGAINPIVNAVNLGNEIILTVKIVFGVTVAIVAVVMAYASINVMVMGYGLTLPFWAEGLKAALNLVGPFFFAIMAALYSLGALLAVYIPVIPYVIFTVSAIGWFIATVEAMVAAPFIALGILSPGGQSEVFGKAEPSLMILFNLFLRPTLIVFGLLAGILLSVIVIKMINAGFLGLMNTLGLGSQDPFVQVFAIAVYVSLFITAISKVFSLIHIIPERVLTYIGGHPIQYGEAEALQAMRHATEGASSGTTQAGKESAAGGVAGVEKAGHAYAHEKKNAAEKKKESGVGIQSGENPPQPPGGST